MNYKNKIAYLSMEIALDEKLSVYAGGLGVLAGDFLRSAADLNLPLIGISLLNKHGYFRQKIDQSGNQLEKPEINNLKKLKKIKQKIIINIGRDKVIVGAWQYLLNDKLPIYFLDTDWPGNKDKYRHLSDRLYGQDMLYRLQQEIILGRGGVKMLRALHYKIKKFHINEGHGILAALELLSKIKGKNRSDQRRELRRQLIFTNHTTVRAGQDVFPVSTILNYQSDFPVNFKDLIVNENINLTHLGVILAGQTNAVSKNHQKILKKEFPKTKIDYITNGVNAAFWTAPEFRALYDKYLPGWQSHNNIFKKVKNIPLTEIASAHQKAKAKLLKYIAKKTNLALEPKVFTLVFARRLTAYKQPLLLFSNIERLLTINQNWPLQIIYAGKAHPHDYAGRAMIKKIYELKKKYQLQIKIIFLENYNIPLARLLTAGADLWLNTPLPPNEACGTSGMKAALNGVPQLSSPDGWWLEAYKKNKNGWLIKNSQADDLYQILEKKILPLYYQNASKWQQLMKDTIAYNAPFYNSERMVKQYWQKKYK